MRTIFLIIASIIFYSSCNMQKEGPKETLVVEKPKTEKKITSNKQSTITIDTLKIRYKIKDIIDVTSLVPQVSGNINPIIKDKINTDLKRHFKASSLPDKSTYIKNLLAENNLTSTNEYIKLQKEELKENLKDDPDFRDNDEEEGFNIEYSSNNLLNISVSYQVLPYRGQYQFSFESIIYDLRTANKLDFDDFFSIKKEQLIQLMINKGYRLEPMNNGDSSEKIKIEKNDDNLERNISALFSKVNSDDKCIEYYFNTTNDEIHLIFKFKCAGPYLMDYGIPLSELKFYLKYHNF